MDSRHAVIEAWWPQDGPAFATRAYEKLVRRAKDSWKVFWGPTCRCPSWGEEDEAKLVKAEVQIKGFSATAEKPWDGIQDALEPIRRMVYGPTALITQETYDYYRDDHHRVICRVAPLLSRRPWAFLAVAGIAHGAPRWMIIDPGRSQP